MQAGFVFDLWRGWAFAVRDEAENLERCPGKSVDPPKHLPDANIRVNFSLLQKRILRTPFMGVIGSALIDHPGKPNRWEFNFKSGKASPPSLPAHLA